MSPAALKTWSTRSALGMARHALRPLHAFQDALFRAPELAQRRIRNRIVRRLAKTEYGASLGVRSVRDIKRIPVVDYDDLAPWLERQRRCAGPVLTPDPILFYEQTSGSSAAAKLIPYTAALRRSYTHMFLLWVADILLHGKRGLSSGKTYISISPSFDRERQAVQGVPVGTTDDSEYLSALLQPLMRLFWVASDEISRAAGPKAFRQATCKALLSNADLEVMSIWNPTFLLVLLDEIEENRDLYRQLLLEQGEGHRANLMLETDIHWEKLWPELRLISCWDAAAARFSAKRLAQKFPNTWMQGKGLLSTEAPISMPWIQAGTHLPLLSEIWLELERNDGELVPIEEASVGEEYGVVVSQLGGLYRYRLGDRVHVGERYQNTPSLVFVGRDSATSDMVGEKLHEAFVERSLLPLLGEHEFFLLVPMPGRTPHYVLILEPDARAIRGDFSMGADLMEAVDRALSASFHYRHARALGQLHAPRLCIWPAASKETHQLQGEELLRVGNLKPNVLLTKNLGRHLRAEILRRTKTNEYTGACAPSAPARETASWI